MVCTVFTQGGYSHILTMQVCATVQGMVFKPFFEEQGIENTMFLVRNRVSGYVTVYIYIYIYTYIYVYIYIFNN